MMKMQHVITSKGTLLPAKNNSSVPPDYMTEVAKTLHSLDSAEPFISSLMLFS